MSDNPDDIGRTQIIIAKHRNGAIADVDMKFRADEVRFVDEQESLAHHAASLDSNDYIQIGSLSNDPMGPYGSPVDEFANPEF